MGGKHGWHKAVNARRPLSTSLATGLATGLVLVRQAYDPPAQFLDTATRLV
jgi:hypothetical protein